MSIRLGTRISSVLAVLLLPGSAGRCRQAPPFAPDTTDTTSREVYRLRIQNARFGRVEVSVDGGEHFLLIGRVLQPATVAAPDRSVLQPGSVVRSGTFGIAFGSNAGEIIRVLPSPAPNSRTKSSPSELVTDIKQGTGIFCDLGPRAGSAALQEMAGGSWRSFPDGYTPSEDDVFGFLATPASTVATRAPDAADLDRPAETRKLFVTASERYTTLAMTRTKAAKRPIVSGLVHLTAKLPSGEPEPITAVTYSIDGDIVSAQNLFPSIYMWNTTRVANGEHVVEVRALNRFATVVTRVRRLVLVDNPPAHVAPEAPLRTGSP